MEKQDFMDHGKMEESSDEVMVDRWISYEDSVNEINLFVACFPCNHVNQKEENCLWYAIRESCLGQDVNPNDLVEDMTLTEEPVELFEKFYSDCINNYLPLALEGTGPVIHCTQLWDEDLLKAFWVETDEQFVFVLWECLA